MYYNLVPDFQQPCRRLPATGPPTIFFDVFWAQQKRKRLIEAALAGLELPPDDYPFYVVIGAEGPWTPTELAARLEMPLSTVLFRVRRIERRGHAERVPHPGDGRSFLIRLTTDGRRLLERARPAFRSYAEAVEARLGKRRVDTLHRSLVKLRRAVDAELAARDAGAAKRADAGGTARPRGAQPAPSRTTPA
jgi:DNA-binding MarR family transcriptional regulator